MATYTIQTTQEFSVTYDVDADSPEEAWALLIDNDGAVCVDQSPGPITGSFNDASIESEES